MIVYSAKIPFAIKDFQYYVYSSLQKHLKLAGSRPLMECNIRLKFAFDTSRQTKLHGRTATG